MRGGERIIHRQAGQVIVRDVCICTYTDMNEVTIREKGGRGGGGKKQLSRKGLCLPQLVRSICAKYNRSLEVQRDP